LSKQQISNDIQSFHQCKLHSQRQPSRAQSSGRPRTHNSGNNDAPTFGNGAGKPQEKASVVVAQRFCSLLVCGFGREKNEFFVAAFAASFESSQNRCVVAANVRRHAAAHQQYSWEKAKRGN
jgi:hypothetical protein